MDVDTITFTSRTGLTDVVGQFLDGSGNPVGSTFSMSETDSAGTYSTVQTIPVGATQIRISSPSTGYVGVQDTVSDGAVEMQAAPHRAWMWITPIGAEGF